MSSLITVKDIVDKIQQSSKSQCVKWLISLDQSSQNASQRAFEHLISATYKKYQHFNKSKSSPKGKDKIKEFLNEEIVFPEVETKLRKPKSTGLQSSDSEVLKDVAHQLGSEVHKLNTEVEQLKSEKKNRFTG